jgi:hypothetical protein
MGACRDFKYTSLLTLVKTRDDSAPTVGRRGSDSDADE